MQAGRILIVGDAAPHLGGIGNGTSDLTDRLRAEGYTVDRAADAPAALAHVEEGPPDLILVGTQVGGMGQGEFLRKIQARTRESAVIALTQADSAEAGIAALREGATAYLTTPLKVAEVSLVAARELDRVRLRREVAMLRERSTLATFGASEVIRIPGSKLADIERYAILKAVEATRGSTSKAAALLGISVRKVQYKLHEYNTGPGGDQQVVPTRLPLPANGQVRATPRGGH